MLSVYYGLRKYMNKYNNLTSNNFLTSICICAKICKSGNYIILRVNAPEIKFVYFCKANF